ncbi:esterase B1 [Drosophila sechellia]|uniref:Carboxylic ester hydrolase n=1 Tax=Drosophila sechellia TaxID=7238 RepID=B4I4U7_DROSE|nr:esterase B1 [Drosophila sechellia]EDW55240.1 GM10476 [Drosophila sechellia]
MSFDIAVADQMRIALNYVKFKTNQQRLRSNDKVIADTVYGKVKGVKWQSIYGNNYYSFEGIPFAKPPVGELRFKAPVEPEHWSEVKRCTHVRAKPCQVNIVLKQVQGSEDCLYLNVYTRELHPHRPLPVLVWIYGGGFQMGEASRDLYSPDYMMMEHVVLVVISYRLGALGFLSLADEELDVPGNAGLKDQVMALRWVKRNCQFFGGDPDNITVFGESAGGASTHYMMLTDQAKGLFHKTVIMSGSALAPWAQTPTHINWPYRLAQATGYRGEAKDRDIFAHLKKCKASSMLKVAEDIITMEERHQRLTMFSFGPTIEPYLTPHCVIPKSPLEMMRDCWGNSIPMVIGGNSFEGLLMFPEVNKWPELLCNLGDCENLAPQDAHVDEQQRKAFGKKIRELYFGDRTPGRKTILEYSDLFSYKYFWHGIHRTLLSRAHHAPLAPTFLYRFDFDSKHFNIMRIITCGRKVRGTCHADDLSYLFYNAAAKKLKRRTAEFKTIKRLVSMIVHFAISGDPNIPMVCQDEKEQPRGAWLPISKDDKVFQCLNISHDVHVIDLPEAEKLRLWDSIYDRELLY